MLESGATPEDIAKVMVEQKLLQAIGTSPDEMSKSILKQLRSGGKMTPESLASVLVSSLGTSMSFSKYHPIRKLYVK